MIKVEMEQDEGRALYFEYFQSPLGEIELCASDNFLLQTSFVKTHKPSSDKKEIHQCNILTEAHKQLIAYFNGTLRNFDLPLSPNGTEFQNRVWNQLKKIPYGETISYSILAKKMGDAKTIRAAASANGKNPIAIIIPCHRVIGSNNELTGYSGDLWRKQRLLEHEEKLKGTVLKLFTH